MTAKIKALVDSRAFQNGVLGLIVLAAVIVGLETSTVLMDRHGTLIYTIDWIIVYLFALEAALKMAAHGKRFYRYFYDPWNVFDFTIVVVCFLPFNGHYAAVLRLVRILRALRLVSAVPRLQVIVTSLLKSLPSMCYVGLLLTLLFYIYAVLGVFLWRDNDPVHFRDLGTSFLSLFRVITLEDWTDIMYIQMKGSAGYDFTDAELAIIAGYEDYESKARPLISAIFFVSFVLLGTMVMLNLVIGVILNSMNEANEESEAYKQRKLEAKRAAAAESANVEEPQPIDEAAAQRTRLEELEAKLVEAQALIIELREQSPKP